MEIIQQIAVKAVEEIFESVKGTGLSDIGKTIKALTPVVSRTVLSILTAFLEKMDEDLVTGAKALRREDGITVKERNVSRTWLTELGELTYKRTYFRLRDGSFVYLLPGRHCITVWWLWMTLSYPLSAWKKRRKPWISLRMRTMFI